ncbi:hypothetical protein NDU88_005154 [Pleurodeles waltl]|uniref:Uncharacterized protein n=1 Tax=Pleurodeles waltl TaxID=8319 RepID=A0AAV7TBQ3_PLEWA|nr:hypothetical protein NDU88_005154 [Pleurodeles waltl]
MQRMPYSILRGSGEQYWLGTTGMRKHLQAIHPNRLARTERKIHLELAEFEKSNAAANPDDNNAAPSTLAVHSRLAGACSGTTAPSVSPPSFMVAVHQLRQDRHVAEQNASTAMCCSYC